ncbi:cell wall protein [Actinoallomurus sp. NPDC052274]|uniref:cell wall protein n=1 Tax=Actinoallomurus sp. NPDC052274 TaxID=3155420 RepID=UPI003416D1A8
MPQPDRRRFLTSAVLGGSAVAGATALGSLAPEAAFAAAPKIKLDPGALDPNFAEGRITGISGSLLNASGSDRTLHRIHVTDGTSIWKLHPTTFDQIKVGDGFYARGVRLPEGSLAADAIWVNIVNLDASIASIETKRLHLDHNGKRVIGHVVSGRTAAVYGAAPAVADLTRLQVGRHVKVIGAWRPDTNEVDIATVYSGA